MGIRPDPIEYGAGCDVCYAEGKTPKYFKAFFTGLLRGSNWNDDFPRNVDGYYDITQLPFASCTWSTGSGIYPSIKYWHTPTHSYLTMSLAGGWDAFLPDLPVLCGKWFTNQMTVPTGNIFYGGQGVIMTPEDMAKSIESITPLIDPDPRMELFTMPASQYSLRYAGKRDATRISIVLNM